MHRIIIAILALAGLPASVPAACGGTDRLAELAKTDPAAYAGIVSRAAAVPNGEGTFWRVTRAGVAPSYLVGTFHDAEVAQDPIDPAVLKAITGARLMLVEMTADEQARMTQRMMTDPSFVFDPARPALTAGMSTADRAAAEKALAARGLPLDRVEHMRPLFLLSQLAQPTCSLQAMAEGKPVLDSVLMAKGQAAGVPVKGLETYEEVVASIEAIPEPVLTASMHEALRGMDRLEDFRRTAVDLYRKGEIAMLSEYEIWTGAEDLGLAESRRLFDEFSAPILAERNAAWMKTMVPEMEQGGVVAVIGAMHLMGKDGLVERLREAGFEVARADAGGAR
jgi:uncharacterized protein YbaP (TraB family)